jgi:hypothetical protein
MGLRLIKLLRPLFCAKCGKQLHECACEEVAIAAG